MGNVALMVALSATTGLFSGHRAVQSNCAGGRCASTSYYTAPAATYRAPATTCAGGSCAAPAPVSYTYAAPQPAPVVWTAPAPQAVTYQAPAPQAVAYQAPAASYYRSYYAPPATGGWSSCPNGSCARR